MAETQFTPGPWVVGYKSLTVGIPENAKIGGFEHLFDVRGWGYFTGLGHGALGMSAEDATTIQNANAYLIAAAPELYEAGEPFEGAMNQEDTGDLSDETPVTVIIGERVHDFTLTLADFRRLQQVRAKARGEAV